jgi:hypothetical protein
MSYAPKELLDLQAYWKSKKGVALGIVGDTAHNAKGTSYHLGQDKLSSTAYSRRLPRDREPHLTNAASAIDLGRLDGSLEKQWKFGAWFAAQCRAGKPDYNDVREVIYWDPKNQRVVGWSDLDPKKLIPGYGDMSHKTHIHISFYRDSENRDKTKMFKPYFEAAPVPVIGGDVGIIFNPGQYDDPGIDLYLDSEFKTKVTSTQAGGTLTSIGVAAKVDADGQDQSKVAILVSTSQLDTDHNVNQKAILWAKKADLPASTKPTQQGWDDAVWGLLLNPWPK